MDWQLYLNAWLNTIDSDNYSNGQTVNHYDKCLWSATASLGLNMIVSLLVSDQNQTTLVDIEHKMLSYRIYTKILYFATARIMYLT